MEGRTRVVDGTHFRIKRHYSLIAHSPDTVELRHGVWNPVSYTLTDTAGAGRLFALLDQLDGTRTPAEIADAVGVSRTEVNDLVDHLMSLGAVESGPANPLDYYLDQMRPVPLAPLPAAERPRVVLLGDPASCSEIRRHLLDSLPDARVDLLPEDDPAQALLAGRDVGWLSDGLEFESRLRACASWEGAFTVLAERAVDPIQLQVMNRLCLALGAPWMHSVVDGPLLLVGPVFVPRRTACFECLDARLTMNMREAASYQGYKRALAGAAVRPSRLEIAPVTRAMLAALTAFEALGFVLTGSTSTVGKLLAVYLPTMEFSFGDVLRLPGCPACGPIAERDERGLYFDMDPLLDDADGARRIRGLPSVPPLAHPRFAAYAGGLHARPHPYP
jgi:bacteriocin biosynthesis cyclodehydratase domain-containing protein